MNINLSISAAPGITTNYLVVAVYDSTAPGTVVASQALAAPHTSPVNISFTNLNADTYYVKIWESPTTSASGTLRHQFLYDPSYSTANIRDDLYLTVGSTPGMTAGANSYSDSSLVGWDYTSERRNVGTLVPGTDYQQNVAGGFTLLQAGDSFAANEVFVIHFQPQITVVTPLQNQSSGILFNAMSTINLDMTLDSTAMGKFFLLQGTNPTLNVTLPLSSTVPDNKLIAFLSNGGSHINAAIKCNAADNMVYLGKTKTALYMGQSEELWLFKVTSTWYVAHADGNFRSVGEIIDCYLQNQINTAFCNGQTLLRAQYPRLWEWVQMLPIAQLITDTSWNYQDPTTKLYLNHGFFSQGDGSTNFRLPRLYKESGIGNEGNTYSYGAGFLRGVDGLTRQPGNLEREALGNGALNFLTTIGFGISGGGTQLYVFGCSQQVSPFYGNVKEQDNVTIRGVDPLNLGILNNETRPANTGVFKLIRI